MKQVVLCLAAGAAALWAADPAGFGYWPVSTLQNVEKTLAAKTNPKTKAAVEQLGKFGNHSFMVVHREGSGEAEVHEKQTDLMVVQSGQATMAIGGQLKEAKNTGPGEIRGVSIEGGRELKLSPGDVLNIPPLTPHQVIIGPGGQITYLTVKLDTP